MQYVLHIGVSCLSEAFPELCTQSQSIDWLFAILRFSPGKYYNGVISETYLYACLNKPMPSYYHKQINLFTLSGWSMYSICLLT